MLILVLLSSKHYTLTLERSAAVNILGVAVVGVNSLQVNVDRVILRERGGKSFSDNVDSGKSSDLSPTQDFGSTSRDTN